MPKGEKKLQRTYELVTVFSPAVDESRVNGVLERVQRLVVSKQGTIVKQEGWGTKRLAYPIQRFREGNYFLTQFQADPEVTEEIESALRVSEEVIRHLLVRVGK